MSRQHHDHLAKGLLSDWLEPLGPTQASRGVLAEERTIDVVAHAFRANPRWRQALGLLGRMAHGWTGFEVFRNPPTPADVLACTVKRIDLGQELARRARRKGRSRSPVGRVRMWVVTPTLSPRMRRAFRLQAMRGWPRGFLDSGSWGTAVVVVHDLPVDPETLFLRLFGRGHVQHQALSTLAQQPSDRPLQRRTIVRVLRFRRQAEQTSRPSAEQREFVMATQDILTRWENQILRRGKAAGKAAGEAKGKAAGEVKGKADGVLTVLEARGVPVPPRVRSRVQTCTNLTQLNRLLRRAAVVEKASELFR